MLGWIIETTIIVALLVLVALIVSRSHRIRPATKHVFWLVALLKLFVPPVINWPLSFDMSSGSDNIRMESGLTAQDLALEFEPDHCGDISVATQVIGIEQNTIQSETAVVSIVRGTSEPDHTNLPEIPHSERSTDSQEPSLTFEGLEEWVIRGWFVVSVALAVVQLVRVVRFQSLLQQREGAPAWLINEAVQIGKKIGVPVPQVSLVPRLGTPLIWCFGRPHLFVPTSLVKSLSADRWRGILAHELAHLKRGDHWVNRLELIAGILWWWNPLYWLIRSRLNAEAELACDAHVISTLPRDRVVYAEVLYQIGAAFSTIPSTAPALGVGGTGQFFERRLTMILRDHVSCQPSRLSLLCVALLILLSFPSWTAAKPFLSSSTTHDPLEFSVAQEPAKIKQEVLNEDSDKGSVAQVVRQAKEEIEIEVEGKGKGKDQEAVIGAQVEAKINALQEKLEDKVGPEFEKKMKEQFGPHSKFAKQMETIGKEIEAEFGPEFEKKMREQFGPDSEFAKQIEEFTKQMEVFGKEMEVFGKEMEEQFEAEMEIEIDLGDSQDEAEEGQQHQSVRVVGEVAQSKPSAEVESARQFLGLAEARLRLTEQMSKLGEVDRKQLEADRKALALAKARVANALRNSKVARQKLEEAQDRVEQVGQVQVKKKEEGTQSEQRIEELEATIKKLLKEVQALQDRDKLSK